MSLDISKTGALEVPEVLLAHPERTLPELDADVLSQLGYIGWKRVGLMVAVVDESDHIMMLEHNKTDKNKQGDLGPLGETTQGEGPVIEQPRETLFRGIGEELGVKNPSKLDLKMRARGGWTINQWPRGIEYPGEYSCAVSFPIFIGRESQARILNRPLGTEEASGIHFLTADDILQRNEAELRPGVKAWLRQLIDADLLERPAADNLQAVDFSNMFSAGLRDIEL